jgi:hypothetical protein
MCRYDCIGVESSHITTEINNNKIVLLAPDITGTRLNVLCKSVLFVPQNLIQKRRLFC